MKPRSASSRENSISQMTSGLPRDRVGHHLLEVAEHLGAVDVLDKVLDGEKRLLLRLGLLAVALGLLLRVEDLRLALGDGEELLLERALHLVEHAVDLGVLEHRLAHLGHRVLALQRQQVLLHEPLEALAAVARLERLAAGGGRREQLDGQAQQRLEELAQVELLVRGRLAALLLGRLLLLLLGRAVAPPVRVVDLADGHGDLGILAHADPLALRHGVPVLGVLAGAAHGVALLAVLEEDRGDRDQVAVDQLEGRLLPEEVTRQVVRLDALPHGQQRLELRLALAGQRARVELRVEAAAVGRLGHRAAGGLCDARRLRRLLPPRGRKPPRRARRRHAAARRRRLGLGAAVALEQRLQLAGRLHLAERVVALVHAHRHLDAGAALDARPAARGADAQHLDLAAAVRVELAHVHLDRAVPAGALLDGLDERNGLEALELGRQVQLQQVGVERGHRQDHRREAVGRAKQHLRRVGDDRRGLEVEACADGGVASHRCADAHDLARLHEVDLGLQAVEQAVEALRVARPEAAVKPRVRRVARHDGPAHARLLGQLEEALGADAALLGQAALRGGSNSRSSRSSRSSSTGGWGSAAAAGGAARGGGRGCEGGAAEEGCEGGAAEDGSLARPPSSHASPFGRRRGCRQSRLTRWSFSPANARIITSREPAPSSGGVYDLRSGSPTSRARRAATSSLSSRRILAMSSDASIAASLSRTSSSCSSVKTSVTHLEKLVTSKSGGGPAESGASTYSGSSAIGLPRRLAMRAKGETQGGPLWGSCRKAPRHRDSLFSARRFGASWSVSRLRTQFATRRRFFLTCT